MKPQKLAPMPQAPSPRPMSEPARLRACYQRRHQIEWALRQTTLPRQLQQRYRDELSRIEREIQLLRRGAPTSQRSGGEESAPRRKLKPA
jgi:hypothetical protein